MRINKLGENLFEVLLPKWYWSSKKHLISGLLEIQGKHNKVVTSIRGYLGWPGGRDSYLITTMDK